MLCLFSFSCKDKKQESAKQNNQAPVIVDVVIAGTQPLSNLVEANGSVLANESLEIHPEVSGRLILLNVPDGAAVTEGTVLAKINDADLQAQLAKSQSQLTLAQKTEDRMKKLLAVNGANQADYDLALNNLNNIWADIQLLKAQIEKTVVKAPFSGRLGLRMVSPGAYVTPQTILATLEQTNKVKIDFTIPAVYASLIQKGAKVDVITTDNQPKRSAIVFATETSISTSTRNLKVRAVMEGEPVIPGAFVKVLIDAGKNNQSILVPTNAIIPDASSKKLIVVKNGKGVFVNIETGVRTANGIEITKGLNTGDSVVVSGVLFVKPNATVKVRSIKKLEELTRTEQ